MIGKVVSGFLVPIPFGKRIAKLRSTEGEQQGSYLLDTAIELVNDAKHCAGRTQLAARASLSAAPGFKTGAWKDLTPEQRREFLRLLKRSSTDVCASLLEQSAESTGFDYEDDLDAAFAKEFSDKLPQNGLPAFKKRWDHKLDEIVLDTR